jgi:hypothetical protein
LPPHRFFNFVYSWAIERIPAEKREEWEVNMQMPVRPDAEPTPAQVEAEGESFMALMGAGLPGMGGG